MNSEMRLSTLLEGETPQDQTNLNKVQSLKNQFNRNKSINPEKHINPLSVVFHSETPTRFLGLSSKSGLVKIIIDKITTKIRT